MNLIETDAPAPAGTIPDSEPAVLEFVRRPDTCLSAMIAKSLDSYTGRAALAWRPTRNGMLSKEYEFISYEELAERVRAVAATLVNDPALGMKPGDPVGIMAFANVDFVTLNLALGLSGMVIAPLQTTASMEALTGLVEELKAPCLAGSMEHLDELVTLAVSGETTRCVLVFDHDGLDDAGMAAVAAARERLGSEKPGCALMLFSEAIRRGQSLPQIEPFVPEPGADPVALIYYTSGSTGTPKGVMYSEKLVKPAYAMARDKSPFVLHYQPLNHSFGMSYIGMALASGGTTYFTARSDLSTLLEDMKKVRPTAMALVPRVCELLYQRFHADFADEIAKDEDAALRMFREQVMGGRLTDVVTGSAPLADDLREFVEKMSGQKVIDGYGATEVGAIAMNGKILKPPIIDYKLIDVPDLGYFTTDKPHPRGELIVKSHTQFSGYFARPDLTAKVVDEDGYYHTGDVVAEVAPDQIEYLDRTNNVMKLAQGEFVPVAKLEALYAAGDPRIKQVYLYGNSSRSFLLAVVVPSPQVLPESMDNREVKARLMEAFRTVAAASSLNSYEVPRDILIEREPFSTENGLLAGVGKYLRPAFRARYGDILEKLYSEMAENQESELEDLRKNGRDAPVLETICRAARSVLGVDNIDPAERTSFAALGGDSLSALSFSMLLEDIYGIPVEVGTIMHPTGDLHQLADEIERMLADSASGRPNAASIHGVGASVLRAGDLTLDKFIDPAVLANAAHLPPSENREPETVLLTGANGFLGRFLCLEWLKRLQASGGKLICVGRGSDDDSARQRLMDAFAGGDSSLAAEVRRLAEGRLEVIAGDLGARHLGLSDERWEQLADKVDLIVNPAAHVNHMLPYGQLFGPNVAGTAELIALALTNRKKRIAHISTIAVAFHPGKIVDEDVDVRQAIPEWFTSESYADGYGASKWAAEVLLAEANEHFGLPVSVFRSNMILAPLAYDGQMNVPDIFTRTILSLALTRLAPESFYDGDASRAHYEGLPVDFIAAAIVAIGENRRSGMHNFHVLNPNSDGISLDTFVDWMSEAGYPCEKVAPFSEWKTRFEAAMRALPDDLRQASLLPLMHAYARPMPVVDGSDMPTTRFTEATREARITSGGTIPSLTVDLIARYLGNLKALSLLPG